MEELILFFRPKLKHAIFSKMNNLKKDREGTALGSAIVFLAVILIGLVLTKFIARGQYSITWVIIAGLIACVIAFLKTDWALIILILSMLLSPEIQVARVTERIVTLRVDDIFVVLIFFGWLAKIAINKQLGLLKRTPINLPIGLYVFILILSTLRGVFFETVSPTASFFFLLKYIEYIMIFFLFANNLKSSKQIKTLISFFLLVYAIVSLYAIGQIIKWGFAARAVCAPFDYEVHPEPNTLAGYLLLLMGINAGLILYSDSLKRRLFLIGILSLAIVPFVGSFSRGGWLGSITMYLTLLILSRRMKASLFVLLILSIVFLPHILPKQVGSRIETTFRAGKQVEIMGGRITFDDSSTDRIRAWKTILTFHFPTNPLLGKGITGIGLADSQYFRVLGEVGLIGFLIFIWLMFSIFKVAFNNFKTIDDPWVKGLSLGFLAGFTGLLTHALTANIFIIVRIMEPFMFMAAVMTAINELYSPAISLKKTTS